MTTESAPSREVRVSGALHLARACYAWSHEGGLYDHIFSSDFQIPGHVLVELGLLEPPAPGVTSGHLRWAVDDPSLFAAIVERNLDAGPPHDDVLIALAFCFVELTDELFAFLVAEGVFEPVKDVQPNLWGKPIASPVVTSYGRELEQRWLHWWDHH